MWQLYAQQALDIAHERQEEARRQSLANRARHDAADEARRHGFAPVRAGRPRRALIAGLRTLSATLGGLADAACTAAARLDSRTA